jgi:PAS domain S-box-containing protein
MGGVGSGTIRVLHVDDEPEFGDLTTEFLERTDSRLTVETATNPADGLERVADRRPDCIVSDYNMPGMDGIDFLEAVREDHPELPFILFTGRGSEAVASEAIAADVTDYLQKGSGSDRYELLANRITNAVEAYATARRASRQEELMRLTEFAGDTGGWELDLSTDRLLVTDGFRQLAGLPEGRSLELADLIGLYHPDDRAAVREAVDRAVETGEDERQVLRLRPAGGAERTVAAVFTPETEGGEPTTLRGVIHDVTDQRERERDLEQTETLFRHAQDCLFLVEVDDEFSVERVNPAYEEETGMAADEIEGQTPREILGEDRGTAVEEQYRECVDTREPLAYEETLRFGEGPTRWATRIAPVIIDDAVEYIVGATRNITERTEREREMAMLRQSLDDAAFGITLTDPSREDNPLVYVNDAFGEMTDYPPEASLGSNCRFLQGERTEPAKVEALREGIRCEETTTVELRNYRRDGTEFWNRVTVAPIYDDDGRLVRYLGTQDDVTERKERERELEQERKRLSVALEGADAGVWEWVPETDEVIWHESTERLFGLDPGVFEGTYEAFTRRIHDGDLRTFESAIDEALPDREPFEAEYRVRTADGSRMWAYNRAEFVDIQGQTPRYVGVIADVTDRKRREQTLERQNGLFGEVQDLAGVGGWEYRPGTDEAYWTDEVARIHGIAPDRDLSIDEAIECYHPDDRSEIRTAFERACADGIPYDLTLRLVTADGSRRWVRTRGQPRVDEDGTVVRVRGSIQDVTDQTERKREIESRNERLDEFASVVSHDLRNPLTVAACGVDAAREERDCPSLQKAARAHDRMETLIDDLLALAREGGTVSDPEPVDLAGLVAEAWGTVETGDGTLDVTVDATVLADESRLKQLFENLFRNAVEHGSDGVTVTVGGVDPEGAGAGDDEQGFYVADDGPGIPEPDRETVFETDHSDGAGGTGFGLRIVEQVVQAHGWSVRLTDATSGGARFEVVGVEFVAAADGGT